MVSQGTPLNDINYYDIITLRNMNSTNSNGYLVCRHIVRQGCGARPSTINVGRLDDDGEFWMIKPKNENYGFIRDGDIVKIEHLSSSFCLKAGNFDEWDPVILASNKDKFFKIRVLNASANIIRLQDDVLPDKYLLYQERAAVSQRRDRNRGGLLVRQRTIQRNEDNFRPNDPLPILYSDWQIKKVNLRHETLSFSESNSSHSANANSNLVQTESSPINSDLISGLQTNLTMTEHPSLTSTELSVRPSEKYGMSKILFLPLIGLCGFLSIILLIICIIWCVHHRTKNEKRKISKATNPEPKPLIKRAAFGKTKMLPVDEWKSSKMTKQKSDGLFECAVEGNESRTNQDKNELNK